MKKLEEMLREKTIKNKLSFVFRIMDVLYVVLALVSVVGLIQSKNYVGSVIVVIIVVLAIAFNAAMSKMLAKMLVEPIESLVVASEKIASGDFEIGTPYESEDELGRLSDSFETAAGILKKVVSDLQDIVEHFAEGNFDVHSNCPDAYVGQLRNVLDELRLCTVFRDLPNRCLPEAISWLSVHRILQKVLPVRLQLLKNWWLP